MHVYLSNTGLKHIVTYLYIQLSLLLIVLSFLSHVSSFLSFSLHKSNFTHGPAVTEMYTFFLSLVFSFLSFFFFTQFSLQQRYILSSSLLFSLFFLSSSLHSSASNTVRLQQIHIYFLLSGFLFSFFKRRLYSQRTNFLASSEINNSIYLLQFGVNEQKYIFLYFLSGVAWDESDKFHHYLNESHLSVHKLSALRFRILLLQRQDSN
ncbi:unnamed protein product [Acanthosepion pharaonis]|uniref:Transmembrane protein n=1 Tax=Acanthosepion pharaonis TaxID=158019 RepID=A0A812CHW6_ACAPH|nr:unnamed protein product [Sepia pharaonis]